jgi:glycerol-3-phosphate dehydrogenase
MNNDMRNDFLNYDLIVIGGGINGTGIVRDAALRGLKAVMIEQEDIACGATGACSGMIHGGARYLISNRETTKLSSIDSGYIQYIASHLIFRIPFIHPVPKNYPNGKLFIEQFETFFTAYDKFQPYKNGKVHTRLTQKEVAELHPGITEEIIGAVTFDEWGVDPFRLALLNAVSANEHGARILTHTEVIDIIKEDNKAIGVKVFDKLNNRIYDIYGQTIVNAVGSWTNIFAEKFNLTMKIRPAKGIHLVIGRRLSNYAVGVFAIDNRVIFIMPHKNTTIIGTTDDDFYGDPGDIPITSDEVKYLIDSIEKIIPDIKKHRIIRAFAGVRPTIYDEYMMEDDLSRDHLIIDHEAIDSTSNLYSVIGGKLAAFRFISEEVVDIISKKISKDTISKTNITPLPGSEKGINILELSHKYKLSFHILNKLYTKYGDRMLIILNMIKNDNSLKVNICKCESVSEAEIRYVIKHEFARTIDDIRRRTRVGMGSCQGTGCTLSVARILREELDLDFDTEIQEVKNFIRERYHGNKPILYNKISIQQIELNMVNNMLLTGLDIE